MVLIARRADRLTALAAALGVPTSVVPVDLSCRDERTALPERIAALGLDLNVVVNNAGLCILGTGEDGIRCGIRLFG